MSVLFYFVNIFYLQFICTHGKNLVIISANSRNMLLGGDIFMEIKEALPEYKRYTYEDYCAWDDDKRRELIDGVPYAMASPSIAHQEILGALHNQIYSFLKGKPCKVLAAPVDVRLNYDSSDDIVVQPDLLVVCDQSKLDGKSCKGAPDMTIEIISRSTAMRDKVLKFNRYLTAGVREYWVVEPDSKSVSVHLLKSGEYVTRAYGGDDCVPVNVLDGCDIDFTEIFDK